MGLESLADINNMLLRHVKPLLLDHGLEAVDVWMVGG